MEHVHNNYCPHCRESLDGGPIPENIRTFYTAPFRWGQQIGRVENDRVVDYSCPHCKQKWTVVDERERFTRPASGWAECSNAEGEATGPCKHDDCAWPNCYKLEIAIPPD